VLAVFLVISAGIVMMLGVDRRIAALGADRARGARAPLEAVPLP
jgi:hypothetical protein